MMTILYATLGGAALTVVVAWIVFMIWAVRHGWGP